jgi:hypothetical protein
MHGNIPVNPCISLIYANKSGKIEKRWHLLVHILIGTMHIFYPVTRLNVVREWGGEVSILYPILILWSNSYMLFILAHL